MTSKGPTAKRLLPADEPATLPPCQVAGPLGFDLDTITAWRQSNLGPRPIRYRTSDLKAVSKLTAAEVRDIRDRVAAGTTGDSVAAGYGVLGVNSTRDRARRSWRHV